MSIDAERAVIGCILQTDPTDALSALKPDDFADALHRVIWAAAKVVHTEGTPVDEILISQQVKRDGGDVSVAQLAEISAAQASTVNITHYVNMVKDASTRRQIAREGSKIAEAAIKSEMDTQTLANGFARKLADLAAQVGRSLGYSASEVASEWQEELMTAVDSGKPAGKGTGWASLDRKVTLLPGDLVIVAGRPSMGKTAFGLNLVEHWCIAGQRVLIFSQEMSRQQVQSRLVGAHGRIDVQRLVKKELVSTDVQKAVHANSEVAQWPYTVVDAAGLTAPRVAAITANYHARQGLDLVIVDYLQLLEGTGRGNREGDVSEMSRSLKQLAKRFEIPVVALSQLNRAGDGGEPQLSNLRESGAIEQDADIVLMLHRPGYYDQTADEREARILIRKQRNGPTGCVTLHWEQRFTRFVEPARYGG
jgi:replicative DNA helicase